MYVGNYDFVTNVYSITDRCTFVASVDTENIVLDELPLPTFEFEQSDTIVNDNVNNDADISIFPTVENSSIITSGTESEVISSEVLEENSSEISLSEDVKVTEENSTVDDSNSLSSNQIVVSSGTVSVENAIDYSVILSDISMDIKAIQEVPTFFEKPLDEYSVFEGLSLLNFVILLALLFGAILKGGSNHV